MTAGRLGRKHLPLLRDAVMLHLSGAFATRFPPSVREVFGDYERVELSEAAVLELRQREQGFVRVGNAFDGTPLLVRDADGGSFEWPRRGVSPMAPRQPRFLGLGLA